MWDGTVGNVYADGTQIPIYSRAAMTGSVVPIDQMFYYYSGQNTTAIGRIVNVRLYNRALNNSEVYALFAAKT